MTKARKQPNIDLETIIPILIGQWRRMLQIGGPQNELQTREFRSVVEKVRALQDNVFEGDKWFGSDYFADLPTLGAYTLYQWIIHYQEALSVLNEIPEPPGRVLDLCAGACPFAFAALRHGAHEVYALDQNLEAVRWGGQICGRYGLPITVRHGNALEPFRNLDGKFDLITIGYGLRELFPRFEDDDAMRKKAAAYIKNLLNKLNPNGNLVLVESSLSGINRGMLKLRELLVEEGVPVQAPCVWKGKCPALDRGDSPCYAQRPMEKPYLVKEIQRAAQINLSSLKMTYFILRRPEDGWPDTKGENMYRVISPAFESHLGSSYYLCGTGGKKKIAGRPEENKVFAHFKRGELVAINNAVERGNTYEITPEIDLRVIAATGKSWTL